MPRRQSRLVPAGEVSQLDVGSYTSVRGVIHASDPLEAPLGSERLVGYDLVISVFRRRRRGGVPEFVETKSARRWCDSWLEDPSGQVPLGTASAFVRAPALAEETLDDPEAIARLARRCGLEFEADQVQVIERGFRDAAPALVSGRVEVLSDPRGAFRTSARPEQGLGGDRFAPLVLRPR